MYIHNNFYTVVETFLSFDFTFVPFYVKVEAKYVSVLREKAT